MAAQSTADYTDRELTVIAILTGSLMFMSDLLRRIPLPLKLDCLSVATYHGKTTTSGDVIFKQLAIPDVAGRDVLILDDILDTGHTLAAVRKRLETARPGCSCGLHRVRNRRRICRRLRARLLGAVSQPPVYRRPQKGIAGTGTVSIILSQTKHLWLSESVCE